MSNNAFGSATDVDPDFPISPDGTTYHLTCTAKDLADRIILVGDPARVKMVARCFDKGSITFESSHREINIATGSYKGERISVVSTGMGTGSVEIVVNEIHVLKEYDVQQHQWRKRSADATTDDERKTAFDPSSVKIIRVGTCGSPRDNVPIASLAITRYGIGMDNTCQYYLPPSASKDIETITDIVKAQTTLGKHIQFYVTKAAPDITNGLVEAVENFNLKNAMAPQPYCVGTTCSGSGFYGCQGRAVGHFTGRLRVPDLMRELGDLRFPIAGGEETVVNVEMENSALCGLSSILGYEAGTVCAVIARRSAENRAFATPEETTVALRNAITVALDTLAAIGTIQLE